MPANTVTHVKIVLGALSYPALRVLWAFRTKTPLSGIENAELQELFTQNILRTDYDFISKRDVVLLTPLGKRCVELMLEPVPPAPVPPPHKKPSGAKQRRKAKAA